MVTLITILLLLPAGAAHLVSSGCNLSEISARGFLREGDFIFGVVLQIFQQRTKNPENFKQEPFPVICYSPSLRYYRHHLAVVFATEEINQNLALLPNVSLGFHIYDSCSCERRLIANTLSILTGRRSFIPNYSCYQKGRLVGFIGHLLSSSSYVMSEITGVYSFPQISYGASDPAFSDRTKFPTFYRTTINENVRYEAIVHLLKQFGWSWVGILASPDGSSQRAGNELRNKISESGGCVEFFALFSVSDMPSYYRALVKVKNSFANVIIVYSDQISLFQISLSLSDNLKARKTWIITSAMNMFVYNEANALDTVFNGSLHLLDRDGKIPGLKEFLYSANPLNLPDDDITAITYFIVFGCVRSSDSSENLRLPPVCTVNDTMKFFDTSFYDVNSFRNTYSIYVAVYALAHALHNMLNDINDGKILKLNQYLKKVHFQTTSKDEIFFNNYGETQGRLDILNWNVFTDGTSNMTSVGTFCSSNSPSQQISINRQILWGTQSGEVTQSRCVPACEPGYRKAVIKGKPTCCYDCVRCSEGHFSNASDMENCLQCPDDQWPNEKRNNCIMRSIDFLSYEEPLGLALAIAAIVLSIITACILGIFIKYRDSPLVKANNQELSFIVLVSLMLSPLCILLFIGRPMKVTCLLRQVAFATIFTISISSVLGKTITVVVAFNAIKPGSRLQKWVGSKVTRYIVLLCSLGEIIICSVWLLYSPPFPDYDTKSQPSMMILKCNEGFAPAFYIVIGYVALLASVCFVVAYFARKLPDMYNEAQHITFSMLVFCSVWISFIPSYLSAKGKYMVAVEIFAILASSSGLLGCIFISKCYIIFFRPELNRKRKSFNN